MKITFEFANGLKLTQEFTETPVTAAHEGAPPPGAMDGGPAPTVGAAGATAQKPVTPSAASEQRTAGAAEGANARTGPSGSPTPAEGKSDGAGAGATDAGPAPTAGMDVGRSTGTTGSTISP
jgi:hypothetical protein